MISDKSCGILAIIVLEKLVYNIPSGYVSMVKG